MEYLNLNDPAKLKAAATYDSASDHFDDIPLAFWGVYGQRTVERLALTPGATLLDVGCGTGASAIPAAMKVGAAGHVLGVDLSAKLLDLAREKAARHQLNNVTFRLGDMTALGFPAAYFDAIISVFSIFFVPEMDAAIKELWRMVKPGGSLAITTWGPDFFAPVYTVWHEAVRMERPDLYRAFNPWDRITSVDALAELLRSCGIEDAQIISESGVQPLRTPQDWWTIVLGSGLRGTVDAMDAETAQRIQEQTVDWLRDHGVSSIQTNVIYAIAHKA